MTVGGDLLDIESGQRLGRYTIVKRLSVGGMAEIFLALARGPGEFRKFVTLKRIHPAYRDDAAFVAMFLEEARISAGLAHANIAQVFDLGTESGELYLAMEFVPGEDLLKINAAENRIGARPPFGFTAMVVRDVLLALHHAHTFVDAAGTRTPIVHRDVSPRNVMVTYTGTVKMIDFGIAKALGSVGALGSDTLVGSSGYMAPEQISGVDIDTRTDVFAAGVVLHELLTGRRLFPRKANARVADVDPSAILPPNDIDPSISRALSDVAMTALAIEPHERWQTARDMARAIEQAVSDAIWEEERAADYMSSLFRDNLERIRHTLMVAAQVRPPQRPLVDPFDGPTTIDTPSHLRNAEATVHIPARPTGVPARRPVVIAVDDSPSALRLLKHNMSRYEIDVVCCGTPAEALEMLSSATPDAIILDVMMPDIDGFELCKRIRALSSAQWVPILFLSAACDLDERTKCLDAGGDDFVKKPYVADELAARLRSHFGRAALIEQPS